MPPRCPRCGAWMDKGHGHECPPAPMTALERLLALANSYRALDPIDVSGEAGRITTEFDNAMLDYGHALAEEALAARALIDRFRAGGLSVTEEDVRASHAYDAARAATDAEMEGDDA